MNTKQYQLDVCLKDAGKDVFSESYKIALRDTFVEGKGIKEQNFKNHVEGFVTQLKINCNALPQIPFKKRQVYVCSFGASAGSEIMGDRPVIVVKATHSTQGEDLLVVPLTSATQQKKSDLYDVFVSKDDQNKLFVNSFARLRQLRSVSKKRLGKLVGTITDVQVRALIDEKIETMLGMEVKGLEVDGIAV